MTITTLPVRRAAPTDRLELIEMVKESHKEGGQFSLSLRRVEEMIDRAFTRQGAVIGIMGQPGSLESMILMTIGQLWYTEDWCLEELICFVRPDYRRSTRAKDMIQFAKRCSDEIQIPLVIGVVSNSRTAAKMDLYRRQLGDPVGGYFAYNLQHAPAIAAALAEAG